MPLKIPSSVKEIVRKRAYFLCEYCHTAEAWQLTEFTIDHVTPVSLGGTDDPANLDLACFHCNRRKSDKMFVTGNRDEKVPLFNPRTMRWRNHFLWSSDLIRIVPLTEIGEATLRLLDLNRPRVVQLRDDDVLVNRHPPVDDPLQAD